MGINKLMEYCIIKNYYLYLKSFKQSSSIGTMKTLWHDILILLKPKILFAENTINQVSKEILSLMSKVLTYAWVQRQLDISPIVIYNLSLYQLIDKGIFQ